MRTESKLITKDNVCGIFNIGRAYEIAYLGDMVIKIHRVYNIDGGILYNEDIKIITDLFPYSHYIFTDDTEDKTVLNLELNKPDLSELFTSYTKYRCESVDDIVSRVERAKNNVIPEFKLNEAGWALFKEGNRRNNYSLTECEAIAETAIIIAQLGGSNTIKIEHLAEAMQYQSIRK